jgi:hypothetical protein
VLSHHAWQLTYGGNPAVVGSNLIVEGHPFTVVGVTAPGFFGETLRSDPPDLWLPVNQEPLLSGTDSALLHQSVSAWLRVIGRLRPGASTAGVAPRLTAVLRDWMQHDSGYPSNWMADVIRTLPKQSIAVVPAGAGVGEMKEQYGSSLNILLGVCGMVLLIGCANVANLLLARSASPAHADGSPSGRGRVAAADRRIGADRKCRTSHRRMRGGNRGGGGCRPAAADAGLSARAFPAGERDAIAGRAGVRPGHGTGDRHHLRRRACVGCDAHGSCGGPPGIGARDQRAFVLGK